MKLSIREIADWKEKGIPPQRFTETHDGTSSGPIRNNLKGFIEDYARNDFEHIEIYDENGNYVHHIKGVYHSPFDFEGEMPLNKIDEVRNAHVIQTSNYQWQLTHVPFTEQDPLDSNAGQSKHIMMKEQMDQLLQTDREGNYYLRSTTLVSPNGYSMTLIKNDKFNKENHKDFERITRDFQKDVEAWSNKYYRDFFTNQEYLLNAFAEDNGIKRSEISRKDHWDITKQASQQTISAYGTLEQFIDENYAERFESVNCKLKTQENKGVDNTNPKNTGDWIRESEVIDEYMYHHRVDDVKDAPRNQADAEYIGVYSITSPDYDYDEDDY